MTDRITITAACPATYGPNGELRALIAYSADQARAPQGADNGGQWVSDSSDQSESQNDEVAKDLYRKMLALSPGDRAKFLAGLSNDQLTRLGKFASTGKEAKGPIADIKNAVGQAMSARGLNPSGAGLKAKAGAKKASAKGKASGKSGGAKGGGKSSGGKKSGGSSKGGSGKSSGSKSSGSKSSGSKSSGSSSSKKTSSGSSASKKTGDVATTTKTSKGKQAAPAPQVVRITPARGGRGAGPPTPRTGPPGQSRPQPVRAAGTAASGQRAAVRIVGPRREEEA